MHSNRLISPSPLLKNDLPTTKTGSVPWHKIENYVRNVDATNPNYVKSVDFLLAINGVAHLTSQYYLMDPSQTNHPCLVVRRDKHFLMHLNLQRPLNKKVDSLTYYLRWTDPGHVYKGKLFSVPVAFTEVFGNKVSKKWHIICNKLSPDGSSIQCKVLSPFDATIGMYTITIEVSWHNQTSKKYICPSPIFILLNAWSVNDAVYLASDEERKCYILDDEGLIYRGCYTSRSPTGWKFNQYSKDVLIAVLCLGTKIGSIRVNDWDDPIMLAKGFSKTLEAPMGIVDGNWSGKYENGTNPEKWTGSAEILNLWFHNQGDTVKYGQCFVFGGLLTTIFRALGIPSRATTCYDCGIDVNRNCTVDIFFSEDEPLRKYYNMEKLGESVWNYHVWAELWAKRHDALDTSCWNAVASNLGPTPLFAIKSGSFDSNYNTEDFYGMVYADQRNWRVYEMGPLTLISTDTTTVGKCITAQGPLKSRLDITDSYKFLENYTKLRRLNIDERKRSSSIFVDHKITEPFENFLFEVARISFILYGDPFHITVFLTNNSGVDLYLTVRIIVYVALYTNETKETIKKLQKKVTVGMKDTVEVKLDVSYNEYAYILTDRCFIRCFAHGFMDEHESDYLEHFTFKVVPPEIKIRVNSMYPKIDELCKIDVSLINPTQTSLKGQFILKELDCSNEIVLPPAIIKPLDIAQGQFQFRSTIPGKYYLKLIFESPVLVSSSIVGFKIK